MKVAEFDINQGIYKFELDGFDSQLHTHPALEIVIATHGEFSLQTLNGSSAGLKLAIIDRNIVHSIRSVGCKLQLAMLELTTRSVQSMISEYDIHLENGVYMTTQSLGAKELYDSLVDRMTRQAFELQYDERVLECLRLLGDSDITYQVMIQTLKSQTQLSEGRISHLFTQEVGVSLKKYLVWSRLKRTIRSVLDNKESLFSASVRCGFHDQAHLSKAFKEMLGISPSQVYNSRIIQE